MILVLACFALPAEFFGQTYTTRQTPTDSTTFTDCAFLKCDSPDQSGGGVYFARPSTSLTLSGCLFSQCHAAIEGGAISVSPSHSFSITDTSGRNCSCEYDGAFCLVQIYSTSLGVLSASQMSTQSCTSVGVTVVFHAADHSHGSTTHLHSLNSSANQASVSGLAAAYHYHLSLSFAVTLGGSGANCLLLGIFQSGSDILCLSVRNSSCFSKVNPGVLRVLSSIVVSDSLFNANSFDYFLGTSRPRSANVTFFRCVLDIDFPNATNSVTWTIISRAMTISGCRTRTPPRTRTATHAPPLDVISGDLCTNAHRSLGASTRVCGCTFFALTTTQGGAISLFTASSELWIEDCAFSTCRAAHGGAVLAKCSYFLVERTRGTACAAWQTGAFCEVVASGGIEVYELSAVECREAAQGTMWLVGGGGGAEFLNASGNEATICGSAIGAQITTGFRLWFATIAMNRKGNCLTLDDGGRHEMSCVSVVGNRCEETALVAVSADLVMTLCIFQGNVAGSFIGAQGQSSARLVRCVMDFHVVAEGSVVLATEGCVIGTGSTSFADCRTRTPMPRPSDTERPPEQSDHRKWMIGGIAGGCGAAVVIGVVVAGVCICRKRPKETPQRFLLSRLEMVREA
jgi:hypothetical protein